MIENKLDRFILARWAYSLGEEIISDMEYNKLISDIEVEYPDSPYLKRTWSSDPVPVDLLKKYNRMDLYRDVKISFTSESIKPCTSEEEYKRKLGNVQALTRMSFKHDGFNVEFDYYNGILIGGNTRGRTGDSLDVGNILALVPKTTPYMGKVKVIGEVTIPNSKWPHYRLETGNSTQRGSVRTAIARGDVGVLAFHAFKIIGEQVPKNVDSYTTIKNAGFSTPMCVYAKDFKSLEFGRKRLESMYKRYDFPTDGLVVECTGVQIALRIGVYEEKSYSSYIKGYSANRGAYGDALLLEIRPVKIKDKRYSTLSVVNVATIEENELRVGYPVSMYFRSESNLVLDKEGTYKLQEEYKGEYNNFRSQVDDKYAEVL